MASWGNQANTQYGQDMDSNGRTLVVTKNSNDVDTITANNTGTKNALKVNGHAEFVNNSDSVPAVKIDSVTGQSALIADGKVQISNDFGTSLEVSNTSNLAIDVAGKAKITANGAEKSLEVLNSDVNDHALYVGGKTRLTINTIADQDVLTVVNEQVTSAGG